MKPLDRITKRAFDLLLSAIGIVLLSPIFAIISVLVALESFPVFFVQKRVGRNGELISVMKFRSMKRNADASNTVTVGGDPRISRLGAFLRRYKLDELPQLINVLLGKMSFVGPRPDMPGFADKLMGEDRDILTLRPGITGPASIFFRYEEEILSKVDNPQSFNSDVIWPIKVAINKDYLHECTILLDICYITATILPFMTHSLCKMPDSPRTPAELAECQTKFFPKGN